jgi:hypothetical protein
MKKLQRHCGLGMIFLTFSFSLFVSSGYGQTDLENALKQYDAQTVKGYIQPLASLYGANISTGTYRTASIPIAGFHISVDLIGMGSLVKDDYKTYTVTLPQGFTQRTSVQPTILGPRATLVTDPSGFQYKGSDGMIDASLFSHGVAQITVGSLQGTEGYFRFLATPSLSSNKFPKTTLYGGGARHSITQYFPNAPLDIAVGFSYNAMSMGDLIDIKSTMIGVQGSKTWDVFTLYGGTGWEQSTLKLNYTTSGAEGTPVNVELNGDNTFRVTAGGLVKLGFFKIFADANIGSLVVFTGGIGFGN